MARRKRVLAQVLAYVKIAPPTQCSLKNQCRWSWEDAQRWILHDTPHPPELCFVLLNCSQEFGIWFLVLFSWLFQTGLKTSASLLKSKMKTASVELAELQLDPIGWLIAHVPGQPQFTPCDLSQQTWHRVRGHSKWPLAHDLVSIQTRQNSWHEASVDHIFQRTQLSDRYWKNSQRLKGAQHPNTEPFWKSDPCVSLLYLFFQSLKGIGTFPPLHYTSV